VDSRVDLYAAGAVLYECLTGRLPHEADSAIVLISKVLEETPVPPDVLVPEVPAKLSALVLQALLRDRNGRPESAAAMHDLLEADGITGVDTSSRRTPLASPAIGTRG
jgi:serine/threonine-protein kinase